jgi:hypothetical protein
MSRFEIDPDVERVLAFMQDNIPACKLVAVARLVEQLSGLLWVRYQNPVDETFKMRPFAFIVGDNNFRPSEACSSEQLLSAIPHDPLASPDANDRNHEPRR